MPKAVIIQGTICQVVRLRVIVEDANDDFLAHIRDGKFEVVEANEPDYSYLEWNGDDPEEEAISG